MKTRLRSNVDGFTMIEMLVVLAIAGVLMAAAVMVMPGVLGMGRADGGTAQAMNALRLARDSAIEQRRNIEIKFIGKNHIQTVRDEILAGGTPNGTTVIGDAYLENQQFVYFSALGDTPDKFGVANAPTSFGTSGAMMFTSEGTFIDGQGDVLNGTLFLGVAGQTPSARAITIFGATALLHIWKWNGSKWVDN